MGRLTDRAASSTGYTPDIREWCHKQNIGSLAERMSRWYYVNHNDNGEFIDCLEGDDGANVRRLLDENLADFEGWKPERMKGYRNWLRKCAVNGLMPNALKNAA